MILAPSSNLIEPSEIDRKWRYYTQNWNNFFYGHTAFRNNLSIFTTIWTAIIKLDI